jgi:cytochrome c peroxidase
MLSFWVARVAVAADLSLLPIPEGVFPPPVPEDNPVTAAKIELGKKLYFDPRLSVDDTVSCATCHDPRRGFADGKAVAEGVGGKTGARNSPTVLNAAFFELLFWDGRAPSLEEQAKQPLVNPVEMAMPSHEALEKKLAGLPEYPPAFGRAFGDPRISIERVAQAIATFERTLISLAAPIDRFLAGDRRAISESAARGWALFNGKARCNTCHGHVGVLPIFSDGKFHNIGVAAKRSDFERLARQVADSDRPLPDLAHEPGASELGRFLVTRQRQDIGAFKTPTLRNVELTAPYMHDGSEPTLEAVIDFYDRGGEPNPFLDGGMRPLGLTAEEKRDLVELLKAFTSDDLARFNELASLMERR